MRETFFLVLVAAGCGAPSGSCLGISIGDGGIRLNDGGIPLPDSGLLADERAEWEVLAQTYQACLVSHSTAQCRSDVEKQEWTAFAGASATSQELHGTVAPGGTQYPSPERAPEGDLCMSHDDIDWNFNVLPDAPYASLLQSGNMSGDVDHPVGVIESEWESMFFDPSYLAKADGGADYETWGSPVVDMEDGDRVAVRGAAVLDMGHSPYRSEMHPPYLVLWGGLRGSSIVVHARASAQLTRPADNRPLANPPAASEALTEDFPLPPRPDGGPWSLQVASQVDWFYDSPQIVVDQTCDLTNGVNFVDPHGPSFNAALASPAAHIVGTSQPSSASGFFNIATSGFDGGFQVTLTPVSRPRQAILGATITASWSCSSDGGC